MPSFGQNWNQAQGDDDGEHNPATNVQEQWSALKPTDPVENNPRDVNPVSKTILDSLRARRYKDTAGWLNSLTEQPAAQDIARHYQESNSETLLLYECGPDKLFDKLEKFAPRFNNSAAGTDLLVSCERPKFKKEKQYLWFCR